MSGKRQNNQWELAFMASGMGESPDAAHEGTEPQMATRSTESPAKNQQRMEEVCRRENFDSLGLPRLAAGAHARPDRTAVYGPVRTVVWEG